MAEHESADFRNDLRSQLVATGTAAAGQWLATRANRKMSDVNRRRLAGHIVNALWTDIENAAIGIAEFIADDDTVKQLRAELDAANRNHAGEMHDAAKERGHFQAEITRLAVKLAAANEQVQKAEAEREKLRIDRDHCVAREVSKGLEARQMRRERDEARELARVSLDILRNVSDEPMRELYGVDDMDEMPDWFTGYGKPGDADPADAAQDGRSATDGQEAGDA